MSPFALECTRSKINAPSRSRGPSLSTAARALRSRQTLLSTSCTRPHRSTTTSSSTVEAPASWCLRLCTSRPSLLEAEVRSKTLLGHKPPMATPWSSTAVQNARAKRCAATTREAASSSEGSYNPALGRRNTSARHTPSSIETSNTSAVATPMRRGTTTPPATTAPWVVRNSLASQRKSSCSPAKWANSSKDASASGPTKRRIRRIVNTMRARSTSIDARSQTPRRRTLSIALIASLASATGGAPAERPLMWRRRQHPKRLRLNEVAASASRPQECTLALSSKASRKTTR
mmetsp:Transcript_25904/g.72286  ORF Transcript_25904/g.72286 Transcript_25904/m.72286 type:complete len:290 (+) Transcript_25904:339-1208(+)